MDFETIILRFRDLVTEPEETIMKHQEIITSSGSVWWGWWKKGNECTPFNEFAILKSIIEKNPIDVVLLDSAQQKIYIANCKAIQFNNSVPESSPDTCKTPEYYNNSKYYGWFEFTNIKPGNEEMLKEYSYIHISSLFKRNTSNYKDFHKKRIHSAQELIQQNRTLWFVKKYNSATDKDFEIRLLDSSYVEPNNFSNKYYETSSDTLLWLSDLHFCENGVLKTKRYNKTDNTLTNHLQQALDNLNNIGGLVITGDITSCGKQEGFKIAKYFLTDINRHLVKKLTSNNIIFCPGNHDFIRMESEVQNSNEINLVSDTDANIEYYKDFYRSIHYLNPNKYFSCGRKLLMNTGRTVEIIALNSCVLQQYINFEGHGFLSAEQLDEAANAMGWEESEPTNAIRIVIMHHHYLPVCLAEKVDVTKASSVVYDSERLMNWLLKYNVHILLHGHKHQKSIAKVSRAIDNSKDIRFDNCKDVYIIGMGSTGSSGSQNIFATLTFKVCEIELKYYQIFPDGSAHDECLQTIHIPV